MSFSHPLDPEKQVPSLQQPIAPSDRFLAVMHGSADLFWILASTGTMDDISPSWLSFTGQQEHEACGNGWLDAVYAVDRPFLEAFLAQPISVGQPLEHTCHIRRKDGIYRLMRLHVFPVCTVTGAVCELVVSGTDITVEQMNEAQLHLALEMARVGLWRYHLGTQHFVATEQWKRLYGLPPDAPVTFETFLGMVSPDDRARIEEVKAQARANPGISHDVQFRITQPDGSLHWMISRLQYLADVPTPSGQLIGSAMDITKVKAAEEQIYQILESITDAFSYVDRQWRYTYVNGGMEKLLGKNREEVLDRSFWDMLPETLGTPFEQVYREAMATQQAGHIEGFHPSFRRWVDIYIYPTPDGLSFDVHDITERKQAEEALRESEARFRRLVDANLIGITIADLGGQIYEANDAFLQMVGYNQEEVEMGKASWRAMTPPEYQELDTQAIKDLQTTGVAQPFEKEYVHKDGKRVPVLIGGTLVRRSDPTPQLLAFVLDLTNHKEIERQKDLMLGMTGHELKTPLTALKGTLQLLLRRVKRMSTSPDHFASELPTFCLCIPIRLHFFSG